MKKCSDCGKLVNEHFTDCPHCQSTFGASFPSGAPMPAAAGAGFAAPTAAAMDAVAGPMVAAPVAVETAGAVASFWIRLGAYMLDYFIVMAPALVMGTVAGVMAGVQGSQGQEPSGAFTAVVLLGYLFSFGIWCFNAVYLQGTTGQTLGKRVCKIIVLRDTHETLGIGRILLREVFKGTISGFCMLGFLWQLFDNEGQTWHDKVAGSYVYYA